MIKNAMGKGGLVLLLCAMLALPVATASAAAEAVVISETVSIREEAKTDATVIATAHNGEKLTILEEQQNWYLIRFDDNQSDAHGQGYVLKRFMMADPEYVTTEGLTYVYAMPSASAKTVGEVEGGESLVVIGEWDDYWAVNLRTASGFIWKGDVQYSGTPSQATARPTAAPTATAPIARVTYVLVRESALRTEASASAGSVNGVMAPGSYVEIGRIQNGYGQVVDSGYWLSMDDLVIPTPGVETPIETAQPEAFRYLVLKDGANVYTEPDTTAPVVDTLSKDAVVTVTQTQSGMGLVSYGRQRGWMLMEDLISFHR